MSATVQGLQWTERSDARRTSLGHRLLATDRDWAPAIARVALGLVMLPHGAQKLLGWFGGHGFAGTMGFFTGTLGIPAPIAVLVILAESLGALALVLGLAGRVTAAGIAAVMVGAVGMAHLAHGFFMNWSGTAAGEGFEYHLLALALAAIVIVRGSGRYSIDGALTRG